MNLTGSPLSTVAYQPRVVYNGDPGSGCSSNQYAQFNTSVVSGPTYGSTAMESGRNMLVGCPDHTVDLAIARNIKLGGGRQVQLRLDAYNAFNAVVYNSVQTQVQYNSPTDQSLRNSQTLADGSVDPSRLKPKSAGFGAVRGAQNMRTMQFTARFSF